MLIACNDVRHSSYVLTARPFLKLGRPFPPGSVTPGASFPDLSTPEIFASTTRLNVRSRTRRPGSQRHRCCCLRLPSAYDRDRQHAAAEEPANDR